MAQTGRRKSRLRVGALMVVGSLIVTFGLLAALEGVLRLSGIGAPDASPTSRLSYQQIYLPILEPGVLSDGTPVFRTVDSRLPYQWIRCEKPADSIRVFMFGGSATAGLGFSPNVTFASHLKRMMQCAYPDRVVELVNFGIVALSSRQVKTLVEDVTERYSPDLLIVYSGNNEFLEIHAEKYARLHATLVDSALEALRETNLFRALVRLVQRGSETTSAGRPDFSHEDLRLSEAELIRDIEMTREEISQVIDAYEENFEAMARSATARDAPILLLSVASNWKWRGRSDLPDDWKSEYTDQPQALDSDDVVLRALDERLGGPAGKDRHELLFRRGVINEELGNFERAREDYRAAMDGDPHLRRALTEMNGRVEAVARRSGVSFLDIVAFLSEEAEHGIIGFDEFYDYVHFTPRGAVLVAAETFAEAQRLGLLPKSAELDTRDYVATELAALSGLTEDYLDVGRWMGFCFEPDLLADSDLWKYDQMLVRLDDLLEEDPENFRGLVYRGNARYFLPEGAADAAHDYRKALELWPDQGCVRANLDRLLRERDIP